MPLDFPASPTDGQAYQGYVYSTSVGAWQAKPSAQSPFYTSDTPPANPTKGDSWFNTNDGTMYVYVYDGNTYQWVEHRSQVARSQVGLVPVAPTSIAVGSGTATTGLLGKVDFTTVSSVSLNGVFTSAYSKYRILLTARGAADTVVLMRLRAGTDKTDVKYNQGGREERQNGVGGNFSTPDVTYFLINSVAASLGYVPTASIEVTSPTLATTGTSVISHASGVIPGVGQAMQVMSAVYLTTVAVDGFTIYPSTATNLTGSVQVYGYNE